MKAIHSIALSIAVAVVAVIGSAAAGYYFGRISGLKSIRPIESTIDTVYVADTARIEAPAPVSTGVRPCQFVQVPVPVFHTDTVRIRETDTVFVCLPREVAVYQDSTYRAVVSGIQPRLDTLDIYRNTVYITETPPAPECPVRWFTVTVGPQAGYGFTPDGWNPYAGFGVTAGINIEEAVKFFRKMFAN